MALALYVAMSCSPNVEALEAYLALLNELLKKTIWSDTLVAEFGAVVMFVWPQVAFALIGGFLSRRFKITITRR
jgi:hypothetical protein